MEHLARAFGAWLGYVAMLLLLRATERAEALADQAPEEEPAP